MGSSDQQKEHSGVSGNSSLDGGSDDNSTPSHGNYRGSSGGTSSLRRGRASPVCAAMNRISLTRLAEERKAKRCRFYRNGDVWFPGLVVAIAFDKYRTWEALLADLTRLLDHPLHLASGVRHIFSLEGVRLDALEQLIEGGEYIASSTENIKILDYKKIRLPQWRVHARRKEALHVKPPTLSSLHSPASTPGTDSSLLVTSMTSSTECPKDFIKPKLITIIRNGVRPRKAVRILLNHRTARSFEQVLNSITEAIKLDSGAVRKVYTLDGRQVNGLRDFFMDDDVFIAYGSEKCSHDDFDLDSEECRLVQPLVKSSLSPRRARRMPSPKPRGRPSSPLAIFDGPGSLPRPPRKGRGHSPYKVRTHSPQPSMDNSNGHLSIYDDVLLPYCVTSKYKVGRVLGDGNFAVVRYCVDKKSHQEYALKIIDKAKCKGKEHMIESEVSILRQVKHPHIVSLIEEFNTSQQLYLVMELVKGGDLFDAILSVTKYSEHDASCMIRDLTAALNYLHLRSIVHRDIKPENLLVVDKSNGSKSLKLGDFGLAVEVLEPLFTVCGTPTYVAPEILAETGYGLKVDIWAAGVITYILLCGFPPFVSGTNNQEELFEQILKGHYEFHSPYWDDVSNSAKELIVNMIQVEQDRRYSADDVLNHHWVMSCSSGEKMAVSCPPPALSCSQEQASRLAIVNNNNENVL